MLVSSRALLKSIGEGSQPIALLALSLDAREQHLVLAAQACLEIPARACQFHVAKPTLVAGRDGATRRTSTESPRTGGGRMCLSGALKRPEKAHGSV